LKPLLYVIFQLLVIGWALVGVIGLDVWYLSSYAYPAGFSV
jgi:hypothetical protein